MTAEMTKASAHLEPGDPKYAASAANILVRHNNNEAEANITSTVRDFLVLTNLAKPQRGWRRNWSNSGRNEAPS